jgi:hypothetical protein
MPNRPAPPAIVVVVALLTAPFGRATEPEHGLTRMGPVDEIVVVDLKNGNHFFWWINQVSRRLAHESSRPVYFLRPADLIATWKAHEAGESVSETPPAIEFSTPAVSADRLQSAAKALDEADTYLERTEAVFELGQMGSGASSSVPQLLRLLSDEDRDVRISVCWALGYIEDTRAVEPLTKSLAIDQDAGVRWAAAKALGCFGADAASAIPALVKACEDPEYHEIRMWAMASLASIGRTLPSRRSDNVGQYCHCGRRRS